MHLSDQNSNLFRLITLLSLLLFMTACNKSDELNPQDIANVKAVMEKRAQAIRNKDLEQFKQLFLPSYNDGKYTYQDIIEGMSDNFRNHENINFTYQRSPVDLKMNSARMVGTISYKSDNMDKTLFDHEITQFRRVDGQWFISAGVNVVAF